jgi:hypothetical protein
MSDLLMLLVKSENTVLQIYHHMFTNMTPRGQLSHKPMENYTKLRPGITLFSIVLYYC